MSARHSEVSPATRNHLLRAASSISMPADTRTGKLAMALALATDLALSTVERALANDDLIADIRNRVADGPLTVRCSANTPDAAMTPALRPDEPESKPGYAEPRTSLFSPTSSEPPGAALPVQLAKSVLGNCKTNRHPAECSGCGEFIPEGEGFFAVPFSEGAKVWCLACLFNLNSLKVDEPPRGHGRRA